MTRTLVDLLQKELSYADRDGDLFFDAAQNARLVAHAERYYRIMYYGSRDSWNLRDRHMFETLQRILAWAGPDRKAVVWAYNSHIGDVCFTEMGSERGELNVGQLCREAWGREAALVGFWDTCRHGGGGFRMGRADGGQDGASVASRQLTLVECPALKTPALSSCFAEY